MLKKDIYDIAVYAAKLYKQLDKYDQMDGEVDFPHWWQGKIIKAREFISSAQHYLEAEEKQPMIDALALEGKKGVNEAITSDYEDRIDQIVNNYFNGDQEVKKAAIEYASIKGARVMGGRSATASLFKDFYNSYSPEVANQAMEVIHMADDDVYFERKEGASAEEEEKFHKKLDTLVHKTFGKRKEEMNEYNINPEAEKYVKRFIKGVAKKYGYDEMDAVHLIYQVLANTGYLDMRLESINEIGMFHDPIGYSSTAAAEDKRALQFVKDLINKGVNKEDAIEKAAEKFNLRVHYLTRYVDKRIDEGATCCGKCGRVHVKGNCKRPFLKGAKHCRNNK